MPLPLWCRFNEGQNTSARLPARSAMTRATLPVLPCVVPIVQVWGARNGRIADWSPRIGRFEKRVKTILRAPGHPKSARYIIWGSPHVSRCAGPLKNAPDTTQCGFRIPHGTREDASPPQLPRAFRPHYCLRLSNLANIKMIARIIKSLDDPEKHPENRLPVQHLH
jgi:hypothetical protein